MSWNASSGAVSYHLQVSTSSSFSPPLVDSTGITGTSCNVSGLTKNTSYYWRVNAINVSGISSYSTISSFTTIVAAPAPPILASPSNSAISVSTNPTIVSWNASSSAVSYHLQVSTSSSFSPPLVDSTSITGISCNVSGLAKIATYYWRVSATNTGGASPYSSTWSFTTGTTSVEEVSSNVPATYELSQNYPNPFNPTTTIKFALPKATYVSLIIYNNVGQEVAMLVSQYLSAGFYTTELKADVFPSGVYFYRLQAGSFTETKKLVLLK